MRPGATRGQFRWKRALDSKGILNPGKFAEGNDLLNRTVAVFAERDCEVIRRISLSCNLSLAPGFSPVGAGDAAPSRFNGFVAAGAENG